LIAHQTLQLTDLDSGSLQYLGHLRQEEASGLDRPGRTLYRISDSFQARRRRADLIAKWRSEGGVGKDDDASHRKAHEELEVREGKEKASCRGLETSEEAPRPIGCLPLSFALHFWADVRVKKRGNRAAVIDRTHLGMCGLLRARGVAYATFGWEGCHATHVK
jgi:hypothetical protein